MLQQIEGDPLQVYPTITEDEIKYIKAKIFKVVKMADYPHIAGCRVAIIKGDRTRLVVKSVSYATLLELNPYLMIDPEDV